MVGPSGSGKSTAWRVLLKALEKVEGVEGVAHIIDPKVNNTDRYMYCMLDVRWSADWRSADRSSYCSLGVCLHFHGRSVSQVSRVGVEGGVYMTHSESS